MQSEVTGRPLEDARKPDAEDLRVWNLVSMSGGVTGVLYLRYRPLLDGPLVRRVRTICNGWLLDASLRYGKQVRQMVER